MKEETKHNLPTFEEMASQQRNIEPEIAKVVNEKFMDMIGETKQPLSLQEANNQLSKGTILRNKLGKLHINNQATRFAVYEAMEEYASSKVQALEEDKKELLEALKSVMGMWAIANTAHYYRQSETVNKVVALIQKHTKQE